MAAGRLRGVAVDTESAATSYSLEEVRKERRPDMCIPTSVLERPPELQHDGKEDPGWWWQQAAHTEEGACSAPWMDTLTLPQLTAGLEAPGTTAPDGARHPRFFSFPSASCFAALGRLAGTPSMGEEIGGLLCGNIPQSPWCALPAQPH